MTDEYFATFVLFARLGFKSLIINYRGSTSFDEAYVDSLPGHVGTADVQDCVAAVDHYVNQGALDRQRLVLWGGSHGGFLAAHLSAQYAHYDWMACVMRNPVIDLSTLIETSDIPDWSAVESLGPAHVYSEAQVVDVSDMLPKSPFAHVARVRCPTLVMLGSADRRVPLSQGLKWVHALRARHVEARCHVYPDRHSLAKDEVAPDVFVNTILFVLQQLDERGQRKAHDKRHEHE